MRRYRIKRTDRTLGSVIVDQLVIPRADQFGIAADDTRFSGVRHVCYSMQEGGVLYTIPADDIEEEIGGHAVQTQQHSKLRVYTSRWTCSAKDYSNGIITFFNMQTGKEFTRTTTEYSWKEACELVAYLNTRAVH